MRSTTEQTYGDFALDQDTGFSAQWIRAGRVMLELELTQKILQLRETGTSPQRISNIQSTIAILNGFTRLRRVKPSSKSKLT